MKVEPIEWLVDEKRNIAVTKKLLFAGVQFNNERNYKGDFNSTDLHYFLNNYFSEDIIPSNFKIKYYLVTINNEKLLAYEKDDILKELYSNIDLVPEDASFYPDNAFIYSSVKEITFEEVKNYLINIKKLNYLKTLKDLCKYFNNEKLRDIIIEYNGAELENSFSPSILRFMR